MDAQVDEIIKAMNPNLLAASRIGLWTRAADLSV